MLQYLRTQFGQSRRYHERKVHRRCQVTFFFSMQNVMGGVLYTFSPPPPPPPPPPPNKYGLSIFCGRSLKFRQTCLGRSQKNSETLKPQALFHKPLNPDLGGHACEGPDYVNGHYSVLAILACYASAGIIGWAVRISGFIRNPWFLACSKSENRNGIGFWPNSN